MNNLEQLISAGNWPQVVTLLRLERVTRREVMEADKWKDDR